MGVTGLKNFLRDKNQAREIRVGDEINGWKKKHKSNEPPIIVIDFSSLSMLCTQTVDNICGGRYRKALSKLTELLNDFKALGCKLVFFCDLNTPEEKITECIRRTNVNLEGYRRMFDAIDEGQNGLEQVAEKYSRNGISSINFEMAAIAHSYRDFHFSTKHEVHLEIVQYANEHNAMAIVSDDTNFLIFDGTWQLWLARSIHINRSKKLKINAYNRNRLNSILALSSNQLPLLATLCGNDITNDITKSRNDELNKFFKRTPTKCKIEIVAHFIRDLAADANNIEQIVQRIFGRIDNDVVQFMEKSINSYNVNVKRETLAHRIDPVAEKLLNTKMYRPYMENMNRIQLINMPLYDFRGDCHPENNLPDLITDWMKRRKGILANGAEDSARTTFILVVKKDLNVKCAKYVETLTYPNFSVPPLEKLFPETGNDFESLENLDEIRWKLFGWIMSFDDQTIAIIKQLPKKYSLISTTLYVLVKNRLITTESADGILYTESEVYRTKAARPTASYPTNIVSEYIRAAHIYNIAFSTVRENFAIAGLLPMIEDVMQFDGAYFQKLMEHQPVSPAKRKTFIESIQPYRIYA